MDLWIMRKWEKRYDISCIRHGVRLRCDKNIDPEVRRACIEFCKWLRSKYEFSMRVPIYLKDSVTIKAMDGEMVSATFQKKNFKYRGNKKRGSIDLTP